MLLGLLSALVIGGGLVKDKIEQNNPYYNTERDSFRNNPRVQKERIGADRLTADIKNGVSYEERQRRMSLGYYNGK